MTSLLEPRSYYKPFVYPWAFDAYRTMKKMDWDANEVPMGDDITDWSNRLKPAEKNLLTQLFRFFTQGDVDIATAYRDRYMPAFKHPEIAMMLYQFAASEANHAFAYSFLLDTLGLPESEYKAFTEFEAMRAKHDYLFMRGGDDLDNVSRLALEIAVFSAFSEGMQLFSSFAMLLNFQQRGLMKGMGTIVEWSIRDESHHVESMIRLFHALIQENAHLWTDTFKKRIYQTGRDMVELEDRFIDLAFALGPIEGMTAEDVKLYIRYVCDRRLNMLGLKSNYGITKNPFEWLEWILAAQTHTNFFESRSTEYGTGTVQGWEDVF